MIDLHLHLDGALSLATVRSLADLDGVSLPASDNELTALLTVPPTCTSLAEYLTRFRLPLQLLQTRDALSLASESLCRTLAAEGLSYAEIRFAPSLHTERGLSQQDAVSAVLSGIRRSGFSAGVLLCLMRGGAQASNLTTIETARTFFGKGVVGIDLAGAEAAFPTADYAPLFAIALENRIPFTIHAGEAAGPESIRAALTMGASRIGHGVRATLDASLMAELAERQIPLECCLTSNMQTKATPFPEAHPLRIFLKHGICATLNTDNPTVSGTTLAREFSLAATLLGLTAEEARQLHRNAERSVFAN